MAQWRMCVSVTERERDFNRFTAKDGKTSRGEKCAHTRLQIVYFDGPITNLFSILSILTEIFLRARAKGKKDPNDSKFGTFVSRLPSEGAASMAVKGFKFSAVAQCCCGTLPLARRLFSRKCLP